MAEGESEKMSRERSAGIAATDEGTLVWSKLLKDVQLQVLSYLPIRDLCRMRCVCKEWRDVIHRRDFRSMYDVVNSSENPSWPAMCYMESSYPIRLVWSAYDYAGKMWKEMSSFPSLPLSVRHTSPLNRSFYSVGGLLCLYLWRQEKHSRGSLTYSNLGVSSWVVWHPFRNKWKVLPPCKHKISDMAPFFVHAFASDEKAKTYKILMAHDPKSHRYHFDDTDRKLVNEIYDSATGIWTDGCEYTLRLYQGYEMFQQGGRSRRGVLCNGLIYFLTGSASTGHNVLLSYDIKCDQWHEEIHTGTRNAIFEWDGRLMTIMARLSEADEFNQDLRTFFVAERDPATRRWEDTGIEIPLKIRAKFGSVEGFAIVASGNHLAVTGYTQDGSFKIAVYKRAENYWRLPPTGAFSNRLRQARVEGLVLHKPGLDWRP